MISQQLINKISGYITTLTFIMFCLTFVLFILKLSHMGHWSWIEVFAPLLFPVALFVAILILIMPFAVIDKKPGNEKDSK